jgi:hypothetical protein
MNLVDSHNAILHVEFRSCLFFLWTKPSSRQWFTPDVPKVCYHHEGTTLIDSFASAADGPYLIVDGTLDDCIRQFMAKPTSQHHLYEIHTAPQGELVSAVLSGIHILEIVRLRDFL